MTSKDMIEFSKEVADLKEELDKAWLPYLGGEKAEALNVFTDVVNSLSKTTEVTTNRRKSTALPPVQIIGQLCAYEHPQIHGLNDELRHFFTLAIARGWLLDKLDIKEGTYHRSVDPLAVIIGSDYTFNFDPQLMGKQVFGDNYRDPSGTMEDTNLPIRYEERTKLWVLSLILLDGLLPARRTKA